MPIKVTFGFYATLTGDRRASWTESRWLPLAVALDGTSDAACVALVSARLGLMASNVYSLSIRQSLFTQAPNGGKMVASRQRNRILVPSSSISGVSGGAAAVAAEVTVDYPAQGALSGNSSQPKECVQAVVDGQIPLGGRSSANLYLAGNPDVLVGTGTGGTIFYSAVPTWLNNWNLYLSRLQLGGWGYFGTTAPPSGGQVNIANWSNQAAAPNLLQFTIPSRLVVGAYNLTAGDRVHVRGIRNNVARTARAVGIWRIALAPTSDGSGNWTYVLANSAGFTGADIITNGSVETVTNSFYNYLGSGTPLRAATRKRGGTLGAYRGRSQPRRRLLA